MHTYILTYVLILMYMNICWKRGNNLLLSHQMLFLQLSLLRMYVRIRTYYYNTSQVIHQLHKVDFFSQVIEVLLDQKSSITDLESNAVLSITCESSMNSVVIVCSFPPFVQLNM